MRETLSQVKRGTSSNASFSRPESSIQEFVTDALVHQTRFESATLEQQKLLQIAMLGSDLDQLAPTPSLEIVSRDQRELYTEHPMHF